MDGLGVPIVTVSTAVDLLMQSLRSRPRLVIFDGRSNLDVTIDACQQLKKDPYTGIVPAIVLGSGDTRSTVAALKAMADEVVNPEGDPEELLVRLSACLQRSDRDLVVHPSTRLPGAVSIQREITARLDRPFAMCYADLDHFKEFNDRYSYVSGDHVIRILATLLHDTVKGMCGDEGFVGHIGGDDFILLVPRDAVDEVCTEIVSTFDQLIVYQYSQHDRRAGYFFGKDRRGQLHRVPLMTLSIGVVTNERRTFTSAAMVSQLATEMKTYAKTLPGSVYAVDRRTDERSLPSPELTRTGAAQ
jgi:diguanylate cyclase (GGDEF)-like protein